MFEVVSYCIKELNDMLKQTQEISQANNYNAYTRLFIVGNETVVKLYVSSPELAEKNIHNLLLMRERSDLDKLKELALPTALISVENKIVGYMMPYIKGITLEDFLHNPNIPDSSKVSVFEQLAHLICNLPNDVFIGDLHARNILIDFEYKIHLIDIDGFSLSGGYSQTVPCLPNIVNKYKTPNGTEIISRNSDIYCFYYLFLTWIADSPIVLSDYYRTKYTQFLKENGLPCDICNDIENLYQECPNTLSFNIPLVLNYDALCYNCFLKKTGLFNEETVAEKILTEYLEKKIKEV